MEINDKRNYQWDLVVNNPNKQQFIRIISVGTSPEIARDLFTSRIMRLSRYGVPILYTYDNVDGNYTNGNIIKVHLGRSNDIKLKNLNINFIQITSHILDYLFYTLPVKSEGLNYFAKPFVPNHCK